MCKNTTPARDGTNFFSAASDRGEFGVVYISVSVDAVIIAQCVFTLRCLFNFGKTIDHRNTEKKKLHRKFVKFQSTKTSSLVCHSC